MNKKSRRNLIRAALYGFLPALSILWNRKAHPLAGKPLKISTRFYSLKNRRIYQSPEDFWAHHALSANYERHRSTLVISGICGKKRFTGLCPESGSPGYEVTYENRGAYERHMEILIKGYGLKKEVLSSNKIRYVAKDYIAVDYIIG